MEISPLLSLPHIGYNDENIESQITIFTHSRYGFMLLYDDGAKKTQVLTQGRSREVINFAEGYTSCFREQLVSRETAWSAIEYFMQTGRQLESLNWQEYEVPEGEFQAA